MKNLKKRPTKQLEKFSTIFTQLGLVLVLFVVYLFLEHKTEQKTLAVFDPVIQNNLFEETATEISFTKEVIPKPKVIVSKSSLFVVDDPIKKSKNDIEENIVDFTEEEDLKQIDINTLFTVDEPNDEEAPETVPYILIENAPVFKGCEGLSEKENKRCFDKKMKRFVNRNFDVELANKVGLNSGNHRILSQFIIDEKGNIIDIKINAPHIKLKKETQHLIEKLPQFTPGKQRNKPVKVKYALPITFHVN